MASQSKPRTRAQKDARNEYQRAARATQKAGVTHAAQATRAGRPPGPLPKATAEAMNQSAAITRGINRYLDTLRNGGKRGPRAVGIGRLPGFPAATNDPDVIARAIAYMEREVIPAQRSAVKELHYRQRAMDLKDHYARLTNGSGEVADAARAVFVEHGAAWGDRNGISYAAWREMGVPATDLRDAGIKR